MKHWALSIWHVSRHIWHHLKELAMLMTLKICGACQLAAVLLDHGLEVGLKLVLHCLSLCLSEPKAERRRREEAREDQYATDWLTLPLNAAAQAVQGAAQLLLRPWNI